MPPIIENREIIGHYADVKSDEFQVHSEDPSQLSWSITRANKSVFPVALFTPRGSELEQVQTAATFVLAKAAIHDELVRFEGDEVDLSFSIILNARPQRGW